MKEFNSQICTTKEQSQRLLELGLKPETADMVYHNTNSRTEIMRWELQPHPPTLMSTTHLNVDKLNVFKHKKSNGEIMSGEEYFNIIWGKDIPAWSLHRLLCMLDYDNADTFNIMPNLAYEDVIATISLRIGCRAFNKEYLKQ